MAEGPFREASQAIADDLTYNRWKLWGLVPIVLAALVLIPLVVVLPRFKHPWSGASGGDVLAWVVGKTGGYGLNDARKTVPPSRLQRRLSSGPWKFELVRKGKDEYLRVTRGDGSKGDFAVDTVERLRDRDHRDGYYVEHYRHDGYGFTRSFYEGFLIDLYEVWRSNSSGAADLVGVEAHYYNTNQEEDVIADGTWEAEGEPVPSYW